MHIDICSQEAYTQNLIGRGEILGSLYLGSCRPLIGGEPNVCCSNAASLFGDSIYSKYAKH